MITETQEFNAAYFEYSRKEMLEFVPCDVKISLEVGCGIGIFSLRLKERGIETWGVEPNQSAYEQAARNLSRCFYGTFEEAYASMPSSHFDAIIFNDVLEHMANPWQAICLAKTLLREDGYIVCSIPNILYFPEFMRFLSTQDFRYTPGGTFDKTHLRFFTKASIIRFFNDCGLEIEKIEGIHPYKSLKYTVFSLATLGYFSDMRFMQFAVRAKMLK